MATQIPLPFIEHEHKGVSIPQRAKDGYVNATAMCKAAGKIWLITIGMGPRGLFHRAIFRDGFTHNGASSLS